MILLSFGLVCVALAVIGLTNTKADNRHIEQMFDTFNERLYELEHENTQLKWHLDRMEAHFKKLEIDKITYNRLSKTNTGETTKL